jgi:hypothetical protein
VLLDKKVDGIRSGCTLLIVHKNAKPSPPNEKPVTIKPKKIIVNTFQQFDFARATEPNTQM